MDRIGEYLVKRLVGEGGMGKVFEAEERLSGRRVALKVLRPELTRSEEARRLFLNEMAILAHLDHPHVVRSLACSEIDGQLVMALEYLEGQTLRGHLLEHGALPWPEAVRMAVQIGSALSVAHRQEPAIVHRDLKPENIMCLADGSIKVMDFGIAKVLEAASATTTQSVGTLQYMSPEQVDARRVDGRSDLYCLGLVLYEMLAGTAPFHSASPRELLNLQCTADPPPLPAEVRATLPKGIESLVFELLQKAPDDRPASADDVLHELEPFAPAESARSSGSGKGVSREARRSPAASERADSSARTKPSAPEIPIASDAVKPSSPSSATKRSPENDTIALVDRAVADRELPTRLGVALVVGLSLLAGMISYAVRTHDRDTTRDVPLPTAAKIAEDGP